MARKAGSPAQERGVCPACGRKTLGNTYVSRKGYAYRQCHGRGCDHVKVLGPAKLVPRPSKPDFPANKREQAVFAHYVGGCERGDLFRYVKLGKAGLPGPDRSHSNAYAAWMAGKALAE